MKFFKLAFIVFITSFSLVLADFVADSFSVSESGVLSKDDLVYGDLEGDGGYRVFGYDSLWVEDRSLVTVRPVSYLENGTTIKPEPYSYWRVDGVKLVQAKREVVGISIDDRVFTGVVRYEGGVVSKWSVPIGDRGVNRCLPHELEKRVCSEVRVR